MNAVIEQNTIFEQLGMKDVVFQGKTYHRGPDGKFYWLKVTDSRVSIFTALTPYDPRKEILQLMRIYEDETYINEVALLSLKGYMETGDAWLEAHNNLELQKTFVRKTLGQKMGPKELENLCQLYYESVVSESGALEFTDTVKEVLKIHAMPPTEFSHPELHELLLRVPDTYYDFIQGIERNTERNPGLQERHIGFLKDRPYLTTSDIIIFASMLNVNPDYTDEWIENVISFTNSDETFAHYDIKHSDNEILQHGNKYQWHIFAKYVKGKGYTFRQVKSLVFVDYMDKAIGAGSVHKIGDDIAMLYDVAEFDDMKHEGAYEALMEYLGMLVRRSEYHNLVAYVEPAKIELFEKVGFEITEDVIVENPYPVKGDRVFMWKKIQYSS